MRLLRIFSGIFEPKRVFEEDVKLREILLVLVIDGLLAGLCFSLSLTHQIFPKFVALAILIVVFAWPTISAIFWVLARIGSKVELGQVLKVEGVTFQVLIPLLVLITPYTNAHGLDISRYGGGVLYPLFVLILTLGWALLITYLGLKHFRVGPKWSLAVLIVYLVSIVLGAEILVRYLSGGHFSIFYLLKLA